MRSMIIVHFLTYLALMRHQAQGVDGRQMNKKRVKRYRRLHAQLGVDSGL